MEVNICAVSTCQRSIRLDHAFCLWHYSHLPADLRRQLADLVPRASAGDGRAVNDLGSCIRQGCDIIKAAMKPAARAG